METKPDQSTDNQVEEVASVVEEAPGVVEAPVVKREKATATAKAARKRKTAAARSKRPRKAAKPVAEPVEPTMTFEEGKEVLVKARDEFVVAIAEPVMKALGRYSQMARDTLSGAVGGFLGSKKRED